MSSQLLVNENLISREQAIEKVKEFKIFAPTDGVEKTLNAVMDAIARSIGELPTAGALKHGRWELDEYGGWHCSVCHEIAIVSGGENYCPNCGSRMDLDEVEE